MINYELIEHTADVGIKVKAGDLKELFKNAALAMFDILAEVSQKSKVKSQKSKKITLKQRADNLDELFVNWLNELLSLSATRGLIFSGFKIKTINNNALEAEVKGEDIKNYKMNTEIKAATYHQLKLEKTKAGWQAEVILDV